MSQQESKEEVNSQVEPAIIDQEDIRKLRQALADEKQRAENYLANWQRAQADFINYKRRSEQERDEINKLASAALMLNLLPVLDDLERAFASLPPNLAKLSWTDGVLLIERKLRASLEAQGLSAIRAVGEAFDPRFHEAVMRAKGKEGIVLEELQKGYKLADRVLRPALVVVGEGETAEEHPNEKNSSQQEQAAG